MHLVRRKAEVKSIVRYSKNLGTILCVSIVSAIHLCELLKKKKK